jgi:hypothetical protein
MLTDAEVEFLHTRITKFVLEHLRNSASPSLAARPRVHCKQLATHYRVPLTGFNQLKFNDVMAVQLSDVFPGWEVAWVPEPDGGKMEYVLLIPLECGGGSAGRFRSKKRVVPFENGGGGGLGVTHLLLVLVILLFAMGMTGVWLLK